MALLGAAAVLASHAQSSAAGCTLLTEFCCPHGCHTCWRIEVVSALLTPPATATTAAAAAQTAAAAAAAAGKFASAGALALFGSTQSLHKSMEQVLLKW
eukprot:CAMPEP_0175127606 /NCGR_PEP_ID=MMETSP0087-20121206/4474_1 /TAXON_ID=136419 /ORGANISM="Unknown Unknown, Strain D1" /LENGTH=98 /DNA_ID=CAMNT_0016409591 /DNA_START=232 /DNA_END=526 /DNA_ORIENTATION=-